jgi:polysaccharide export outer membrane protein
MKTKRLLPSSRFRHTVRSLFGWTLAVAIVLTALPLAAAAWQSNAEYIIGPQDLLAITVFDQPDLSGKYTVEADGTFSFPMIGRVKAGGVSLRTFETELKKKLVSDGIFRNPQVTVAVEQYRSQRVFVVGEVRTPGTYALTGDMSLIEALARAGSTTDNAAGEALIVRSKVAANVDGPLLPEHEGAADVTRVDIKELQSGRLSQNAQLRDGDTIFIPRAELVYVFGQVKDPGGFPLQKGTTVLQALSLAGGVTDRGAAGRIRIARVVAGKKTELKAKLEDVVLPGDTIIVPERFF